jgi:hypothetical protein
MSSIPLDAKHYKHEHLELFLSASDRVLCWDGEHIQGHLGCEDISALDAAN